MRRNSSRVKGACGRAKIQTKHLSDRSMKVVRFSQIPSRDINPEPAEYEAEVADNSTSVRDT